MSESDSQIEKRYEELKGAGLSLDMTRGQPSEEQFALSNKLITALGEKDYQCNSGTDCRNYPGGVLGLKEARELFGKIIGVPAEQTIVGNNSSLSMMHNVLSWLMLRGACGVEKPWFGRSVKFICTVPGYDRHFTMLESLGIQMIPVQLGEEGPDLEEIQKLVEKDDSIKGLITVPQYNNPTGLTFSDEVVIGLAELQPKASDFTIIWDNAYAIHDIENEAERVKNILACCRDLGCSERAIVFSSTSKVTFSGAGLGFMGASEANIKYFQKLFTSQMICPNKVEQLRQVKFFQKRKGGLEAHMKEHSKLVKPKFDAVYEALEKELSGTELARWSKPKGGYFISLDVPEGKAKKVVELAAEAGVKLTPAGATFPKGNDPKDENIRISPTRPPLEDVKKAAEVLALCVRLA